VAEQNAKACCEIKDVKRHSFYLKPGEKRRVKQAMARKRARKKGRKESD
jgi:small subunit ribosomal protein S21